MKKFTKSKLTFLMLLTLLFFNTAYCNAATLNMPQNSIAANEDSSIETTYAISPMSTSAPSTYIDLSYGTQLAFDVVSLTYGNLFTNYGFTNVKAVQVDVGKISVNKNGSADNIGDLTITLHKKGSYDDLASINVSISGGTVYFYNLSPSTSYYFEFEKRNDGQIFTFNGKIIDASALFN